jgi:uncharacterized protein (TIGR03545 family)
MEVHMRWGYLIPRLIIVGLIWAFTVFGFDPLLHYSATETLQSITGAKADIEELETGFFPPRGSVRRVALASADKPGTNLLEFDEMKLNLAGAPLLRRSYVVDEAKVTGVRFGTSRSDNGQLERDPNEESAGPTIPPWISDKLKEMGDEWIENFTEQAKAQLDPNRLESYRVGNELYAKWDTRFKEINIQIKTTREQIELLQQQVKDAKKGETIDQIQKYIQVAADADLMIRRSRELANQFRANVPLEARSDFARLDQAQKNDRETVANSIRMLKPDPRRISESLIGEEMYVQLQQMLTWVEFIRDSLNEVKGPPETERLRGRDYLFPILNPTPKILCRKMLIDGELMLSHVPTPFQAVLTDVTSDPKLHGRPALLQVSTAGEMPVQLVIRHDATQDVATTDLAADYTDRKGQRLSAGKAGGDRLVASLNNMHWKARMSLVENQVTGQIDVSSDFGNSEFQTKSPYATALAGVTQDTLASISTINATIRLDGSILKPHVTMTSDLGEKVAAGFETAFAAHLPQMKQQAMALVTTYALEQNKSLADKLGKPYQDITADYETLVASLGEIRALAQNLRSGQVDPNAVFKQVSQSGLLKDKDQQKAEKYLGTANKVLGGMKDPNTAIQDALPGLRKKLFR